MLQKDKMMEKAAWTGNKELEKCTEEWHNKYMENEFAIIEYIDVLMKKMPDSMRARAVKETILMRNLAMRSGRVILRMFIDEMEKERIQRLQVIAIRKMSIQIQIQTLVDQ
jgi:hypothetical protein